MKHVGIGIIWIGAGIAIAGTAFGAPEDVFGVALVVVFFAAATSAAIARSR